MVSSFRQRVGMESAVAICGITAYGGKEWTVEFASGECNSQSLSGYGPFPRIEYHRIPVIRFDKAKLADVLDWLAGPTILIEECHKQSSSRRIPLAKYLERARLFNIPVDMPAE